MFITHDIDAGEMLAEHLKGLRVSPVATAAFANLRHDRDLCPHIADQLSTMLGVYRAYGQEVHDIQSFRDDGVDVLLRNEDREGQEKRVGIQIKSEDEFRKWEDKKLSLIQILKGQTAQAAANVRLDRYYILLCVDAVRHKSRIRTVCSELKNFPQCEIIEPVDILGFYQLSPMDIWVRTTRLLCQNDNVLLAATSECDSRDPDLAFFVITLVCQTLGGHFSYVDDDQLFEIWNEWEDFAGKAAGNKDRLSDILWALQGDGILGGSAGDDYSIQIGQLPAALCALYYDLKVRSSDGGDDLRDNILGLVELSERLGDKDELD